MDTFAMYSMEDSDGWLSDAAAIPKGTKKG